jgi:hypothetical protein
MKRDLMLFVLFLFVGPFLALVYAELLGAIADPEPGYTQECWDRLGLALLAALGLIAWELGLAIGCLHRYVGATSRSRE